MSTFGDDLIRSMEEALAICCGAPIGRVTHYPREAPPKVDPTPDTPDDLLPDDRT